MNGYHIGLLIEQERNRKKISRKQLALGIFSQQMLSKLENDQCESDMLQVEMLLQRLGRSPDKLEVFMPLSEYKKIKMRDLIEEVILKNKPFKADYLLERYKDAFYKTEAVHQMYYYRTKAYLLMRTGGSIDEALEYIIKAIDITLPGWQQTSIEKYLISTYEMENLLAYGKLLHMTEENEKARGLLVACEEYITKHFTDTEECAKIYPKCVWLLSKVCPDEKDDNWITEACEKALDILRREAIGYFSTPVIEEIMWRYRRMKNEERASYWQRFYDTFISLYTEYVPDMCQDSLFRNVCQRAYYLDYEMIRGERLAQGITQEGLIVDVYESVKPLSDIENHRKTARKNKYESLMNRMGVDKRRCNGILATDSFDVLQKKNVLDYFVCTNDISGIQNTLDELKEMLDMSIVDNRRFIRAYQILLARKKKICSTDVIIVDLKSLLKETYNIEYCKTRIPMRNEVFLINQIGICYANMGNRLDQIEWLKKNIYVLKKSNMGLRYNMRSVMLLMSNYIIALYENGNKDEMNKISNATMILELTYGKTRALADSILTRACASVKEKSIELRMGDDIKRAAILCEFNLEYANAKDIMAYYESLCGEGIL